MSTTGRAARFAYDPQVLLAFIDHHTTYVVGGSPTRQRRLLNGYQLDQHTDWRTIRRWRVGKTVGVTKPAAHKVLRRGRLTLSDFHDWAADRDLDPVLRNTTRRP